MEEFSKVSFLAPKSFVNISFWEELYKRKLDMYGLSNEQIPLRAFLSPSEGENVSALTVTKESFEGSTPLSLCPVYLLRCSTLLRPRQTNRTLRKSQFVGSF